MTSADMFQNSTYFPKHCNMPTKAHVWSEKSFVRVVLPGACLCTSTCCLSIASSHLRTCRHLGYPGDLVAELQGKQSRELELLLLFSGVGAGGVRGRGERRGRSHNADGEGRSLKYQTTLAGPLVFPPVAHKPEDVVRSMRGCWAKLLSKCIQGPSWVPLPW